MKLEQFLTKTSLEAYRQSLIAAKLPASTISRKLYSLKKFDQFANHNLLKKEIEPDYQTGSEKITISAPVQYPSANKLRLIYQNYINSRFSSYLHLAILVLFSASLAVFGYNQIFKEAQIGQAYPQAPDPQSPNRYLSFQARLTDTSDNPITTATDVRFMIYNDDTASAAAALWEELRYVDPDPDGIFSVTLGTEQAISSTVFTENTDLWLGVTVETDAEATPRQRIATVGYALNAETLQGFPPSASASADQIPVLTQEGDLVLAAANPMVYSSSGTFSIKGQALTITTDEGTNGDIQIAPNGTGNLDINLSSTAQNGIYITNSAQTTGHLIQGYVGNDTATGDLLNLSSGSVETEKFTVDQDGNVTLAGDLTITGGNITSAVTADSTLTVTGTLTANGTFDANGEVQIADNNIAFDGASTTFTTTGAFTLAPGGAVILGDGGDTAVIDTSDWDINAIGDMTGIGDITSNGDFTTTGNVLIDNQGDLRLFEADGGGTNFTGFQAPAALAGDVLYTLPDADALVSGYVLSSNASGTLSWIDADAAAGSSIPWEQGAGILYPKNSTVDVLIGGQATTSAKFAVLNMDSGTPTASISANSGGNATYLTGLGNLGTTNGQTLTLGGEKSGNVLIQPNQDITNYFVFNSDTTDLTLSTTDASNLTLDPAGYLALNSGLNFIADTANTGMTQGLTINQAGNDDEILSFKNSDVAHAMTGIAENDTFGRFTKPNAAGGGLQVTGLRDADGTAEGALYLVGYLGENVQTTKLAASGGVINLVSAVTNGGTGVTTAGADGNLVAIRNNTTTKFIFDAEGTVHHLPGSDTNIDLLTVQVTDTPTIAWNEASDVFTFSKGLSVTGGVAISGTLDANGQADIGDGGDTITLNGSAVTLQTTGAGTDITMDPVDDIILTDFASCTALETDVSGILTCGSDGGGGGMWQENTAAISPINNTWDVLIGSTATTSAKFAFMNVNSSTPIASVSANSGNIATYLTGDGTLATTNRNSLTIGNSTTYNTTGNVLINPNGTGNVGIGTTTPGSKLDISAGSAASAIRVAVDTGVEGFTMWDAGLTLNQFGITKYLTPDRIRLTSGTGLSLHLTTNAANSGLIIDTSGLVGIGDTTPAALLTVGNGDLFQVNSSGIIAAIDGVAHTIDDVGGNLTLTSASNTVAIADGLSISGTLDANGQADIGDGGDTITLNGSSITLTGFNTCTALETDGTGLLSCGADASGAMWQENAAAISPINNTWDVLIGSTATTSAKFGFLNVDSGTPTASISGSSAGFGLYLTGDGSISTTLNRSLLLNSGGGNVGIGTTTPDQKLEILDASNPQLRLSQADNTVYADFQMDSNGDLVVAVDGTSNQLVLDNSGYVGLGLAAPRQMLDVAGNILTVWADGIRIGMEFEDGTSYRNEMSFSGTNRTTYLDALAPGTDPEIIFRTGTVASPQDRMIVDNAGNVGIGDTTPAALFTVGNTDLFQINSSGIIAAIDGVAHVIDDISGDLRLDSAGGGVLVGTGTPVALDMAGDDLFVTDDLEILGGVATMSAASNTFTGKALTIASTEMTTLNIGNADTGTINFYSGSNVLTGTGNLTLAGSATATVFYDSSSASYYLDPANTGTSLSIDGNIVSNGAFSISSNGNNNITINAGSGTVIIGDGTGKLNAGTVDPPYTINGEKYATYMPGMTGVKEETTGAVAVTSQVAAGDYAYVIDFKTIPAASDLWLFSKTTDLKKHIGDLVVLLSPEGNSRAWYEVDQKNYRLTVHASRPTTVSYRLTAPRFDAAEWANRRNDDSAGFIIDDGNVWPEDQTATPQNFLAGAVDFFDGIISNVASFNTVKAGIITPLQGDNIFITGNVAISGDATISGTLTADKIKSSTIESLREKLENLSQNLTAETATATAEVDPEFQAWLETLESSPASPSAEYADLSIINAESGFFSEYLAVLGQAVVTDLQITNSVSLTNLTSPTGTIDLAGNFNVNGNLTVTGNVTLLGDLTAPTASFGALLARNIEAETAKIDELTTNQLVIAADASASAEIATNSASINTNATAGKGVLPAGLTEYTIYTPRVDASSLIYVTPVGDPQNQVLYVKAKQVGEWFKVGLNQALPVDLEFNWWIIKLEENLTTI
jgi:hypothetical protein